MEEGLSEGHISNNANNWHIQETIYLIWLRKSMEFTFGSIIQADAWNELAGRLKTLGYERTGEMCEERFKYLLLKRCNHADHDKPDSGVFMKLEAIYGTPLQEPKPVDPQPDPVTTSLPQSLVGSTSSSKWPKLEIHTLIQLRVTRMKATNMLWEEISDNMQRLGFKRSPKACKRRWEKLNRRYQRKKAVGKESHWRYFLILKAAELIFNGLSGGKKSQKQVNPATKEGLPKHNFDLNLDP